MAGNKESGKARAAKMTPERRAEIAKQAAAKRWGKAQAESTPDDETPAKLTADELRTLFGEALQPFPISNLQWGASPAMDDRKPNPGWKRVPGCCRIVKATIPNPIPFYAPKWAGWRGVPTKDGRVFDCIAGHQMKDLRADPLTPGPRPTYGSRLKVSKRA